MGARGTGRPTPAGASSHSDMTLLLVIAAAWIAVAAFFVALCRTAARSDAAIAESVEIPGERAYLPGIVLSGDLTGLAARDLRPVARHAVAAGTAAGPTR